MTTFLPKVVLLGDASVGKTCIAGLIRNNQFDDKSVPTVGADDIVVNLSYDNKNCVFKLWDTAGQEKFQALAPMYIRGCHVVLLVFDLTRPDTLQNINTWFGIISQTQQRDLPKIILIGNKHDLPDQKVTPSDRIEKVAELKKLVDIPIQISSLDMSAKTRDGEDILKPMLLDYILSIEEPNESHSVTVNKSEESSCC